MKKKVLYLTNIEVPYRTRFFNELAKECDLTVLYERKRSSNRNSAWASGEQAAFRKLFLRGIPVKNENTFSLGIFRHLSAGYDKVIVGCYNSPVQMLAILWMRLFGIPYLLNVDGEVFLGENGLKSKIKRFFLSGAAGYLAAGEKAAESLRQTAGDKTVYPYYFSSLTEQEIQEHRNAVDGVIRKPEVLTVGQYFDYKGMDVALAAARKDPDRQYVFVGMGSRTEGFLREHEIPENVTVIPFLQKKELEEQYRSCAMLVLPSRQECWGLVVNEAASFGLPIVSTWGSGAAVEFLGEQYPQYLAQPGDADSLLECIHRLCREEQKAEYSAFLLEKSREYSIEKSVRMHMMCLNQEAIR